ncbi:TPA: phage tail tape measure protein [Vibrio vulnificus]|nr:phage tail tape measure protein [Vibrio vulnificus]
MAREFKLSLLLSARDEASKSITRSLRETVKETQKAEQAQEKLNRRQKTTAQDAISQGRARTEDMKRQSRAYETLGIRSERAIQREISQTIAAYNRLARSGMMSADEQARAFDRMRQRVGQLRGEMKQMSNMKIGNIGSNIVTAAGGLYAGARVVEEPVKNQMSYSRRLADMSNTAFNDRDEQGRIVGKAELDQIIQKSVAAGGGTKEQAADLLGGILAKGVFDIEEVKTLMPLLQQYMTATGVGGEELAKVTESLKMYGITSADEMMKVMDVAIRSGQEGSFEFADMARWMPAILSKAQALGYSGPEDIAKLLAYGQGMMKNAPNADIAGNNFVNLLNKIPSRDLAMQASKIKVGKYGIDMAGTLTQAQEKGIDPVTALVKLTDVIAAQNPEFRELDNKLKNTDKNSPEYQRLLESQRRILESSEIGQLISDQQALMALLAAREYRGYIQEVEHESKKQLTLPKGQGEGYVSFAVVSNENEFKLQQAKNQADFASMNSVESLSNTVGTLSDQFTKFSTEFPTFTAALMGAKTGIEAMTQAAVAFAALKFLFGGAGAGSTGGVAGTVGTSGAAAASGGWLKPGAFKLAGLATAATEFATANTPEEADELNTGEARMNALRAKYGQGLIDKAKKRFQPIYQFGRGYAAENEEWVSQYIREQDEQAQLANAALSQVRFMSERAGMKTDALPKEFVPDYARPVSDDVIAGLMLPVREIETLLKNQQTAPQPIEVRSVVELDGHVIAETVNNINGNDAGRTTGGGL